MWGSRPSTRRTCRQLAGSAKPRGRVARILADADRGRAGAGFRITCGVTTSLDTSWLSTERFAEYLDATGGDIALASRLYEWNVSAASALFELVAHFEVILRNAIVREFDRAGPSPMLVPGTPWLQGHRQIEEVISRLKARKQPQTAGRVYAGLTFGFWRSLFGADNEELWRHSLRHVFRHSRANRQVIAEYLESVNQLRNRIAHHGSLLEHDIIVEATKLFRLTSWIDPVAEGWLRSIERVTAVASRRPVQTSRDTVVITAKDAWKLYREYKQPAFVFPPGRSVRVPEYLAFYEDREVKETIPRITKWYDAVDWNAANARRLKASSDPHDQTLSKVISATTAKGWSGSVYQVFLLSAESDSATVHLSGPVAHTRTGRGSAFVKSHRYLPLSALRSARDTRDLS